jgi:hypothetical protein
MIQYVLSSPTTPRKLAEYEEYAVPDWDSLGAEPITSDTLHAARRLLDLLPLDIPPPPPPILRLPRTALSGLNGTLGLGQS